jgi:hypothetical protein
MTVIKPVVHEGLVIIQAFWSRLHKALEAKKMIYASGLETSTKSQVGY